MTGLSSPQEVPLIRMTMPGHAERTHREAPAASGGVHPPSMDEAKRLDEECYEKFIKVQVKHITDGQVSWDGQCERTCQAWRRHSTSRERNLQISH